MTRTEELLRQAASIAAAVIPNPSEEAVLSVFDRLCGETDEIDDTHQETAPDQSGHTPH